VVAEQGVRERMATAKAVEGPNAAGLDRMAWTMARQGRAWPKLVCAWEMWGQGEGKARRRSKWSGAESTHAHRPLARPSGQRWRGHGVLKARRLGAVAEQGTVRLCKVRQRVRGTMQAWWQRLSEHEQGLVMRRACVARPRRGCSGKVGACVKRARPVVASLHG